MLTDPPLATALLSCEQVAPERAILASRANLGDVDPTRGSVKSRLGLGRWCEADCIAIVCDNGTLGNDLVTVHSLIKSVIRFQRKQCHRITVLQWGMLQGLLLPGAFLEGQRKGLERVERSLICCLWTMQ